MVLAEGREEFFVRFCGFMLRTPVRVDPIPAVSAKLMSAHRTYASTPFRGTGFAAQAAFRTSRRSCHRLPSQHLAQRLRGVVDRFVQFAGIFATGLREVGLAAALAAYDRGELVDQRVRVHAAKEIL